MNTLEKSNKLSSVLSIIFLSFLMIGISLIISHKTSTSEVTWVEERGYPLVFITFDRYSGPCGSNNDGICEEYSFRSLNVGALIIDELIFIFIVSIARWIPRQRFIF